MCCRRAPRNLPRVRPRGELICALHHLFERLPHSISFPPFFQLTYSTCTSQNVSYTVINSNDKKSKISLLNTVSGYINHGEMSALVRRRVFHRAGPVALLLPLAT